MQLAVLSRKPKPSTGYCHHQQKIVFRLLTSATRLLHHTSRTVVRECFKGDEASQLMEKAKIRPLATPKPLNRSSQKLAGVIRS